MRERQGRHLEPLFATDEVRPRLKPTFTAAGEAAEPKPPPEFTWREYAIYLLTIAAQIEHSLMVQYLYAAFSLGGAQVPKGERDSVAAWRQIILGIAKEEMGHLATVQNALRFLGAPLALDREDYPWDSQLAPYPFVLEPLSRGSLARYILAESPATWPDGVSKAERDEIEALAGGADKVNRVGKLFDLLLEILEKEDRIPSSAFHPETYDQQASWDEWARGYGQGARGSSISGATKTPDVLVHRMVDRSQAIAALKAVAVQGEAPSAEETDDDEASHFSRFLRVWREFPRDGTWDATLELPTNPVAPGTPVGAGQTLITSEQGGLWANVFNLRYRMLLTYLGHTFHARGDAPPGRRGVVINRMFGEMYNLRAIAALLVREPLAENGRTRCGPPFQMPYALQLPESEEAYWTLHCDLIDATAELLAEADQGGAEDAEYARALRSLDAGARREMELYARADAVRTGTFSVKQVVQ